MALPVEPARIVWQRSDVPGTERATVTPRPDGGLTIEGVIVVVEADVGHAIEYAIDVGHDGATRRVEVDDRGTEHRRLVLAADGLGRWSLDGRPIIAATAEPIALDPDLGFSPITNSLPIWRLRDVPIDRETPIRVAWVLFPSLEVVEGRQWYTRLAEHRWRYRSEGFTAELEVGDDGLVVDYYVWRLVAR